MLEVSFALDWGTANRRCPRAVPIRYSAKYPQRESRPSLLASTNVTRSGCSTYSVAPRPDSATCNASVREGGGGGKWSCSTALAFEGHVTESGAVGQDEVGCVWDAEKPVALCSGNFAPSRWGILQSIMRCPSQCCWKLNRNRGPGEICTRQGGGGGQSPLFLTPHIHPIPCPGRGSLEDLDLDLEADLKAHRMPGVKVRPAASALADLVMGSPSMRLMAAEISVNSAKVNPVRCPLFSTEDYSDKMSLRTAPQAMKSRVSTLSSNGLALGSSFKRNHTLESLKKLSQTSEGGCSPPPINHCPQHNPLILRLQTYKVHIAFVDEIYHPPKSIHETLVQCHTSRACERGRNDPWCVLGDTDIAVTVNNILRVQLHIRRGGGRGGVKGGG